MHKWFNFESVSMESQKMGVKIMFLIMMSKSSAALRLRPVPMLRGSLQLGADGQAWLGSSSLRPPAPALLLLTDDYRLLILPS